MATLQDRFRAFMEEKGLTPLQLAEELQVQRSSISHILNGRNKPSLDFLKKLISVYPDIDLHHLISGESQPAQADLFSETQKKPSVVSLAESPVYDTSVINPPDTLDTSVKQSENNDIQKGDTNVTDDLGQHITSVSSGGNPPEQEEPSSKAAAAKAADRKLLKVVLLYSDGSFEEYTS